MTMVLKCVYHEITQVLIKHRYFKATITTEPRKHIFHNLSYVYQTVLQTR